MGKRPLITDTIHWVSEEGLFLVGKIELLIDPESSCHREGGSEAFNTSISVSDSLRVLMVS